MKKDYIAIKNFKEFTSTITIKDDKELTDYKRAAKKINEQLNLYSNYIFKKIIFGRNNKMHLRTKYENFLTNINPIIFKSKKYPLMAVAKNFKKDGTLLSKLYYELSIHLGMQINNPLSYKNFEDETTITIIEMVIKTMLDKEISEYEEYICQ